MKIHKYFIWFFMLSKRLLCQWSFVVLLCLIPISVILTNAAISQKSGIFHILLCNESYDEQAAQIIDSIMKDDGVIMFSLCDSSAKAQEAVQNHEADAAWVFPEHFGEQMSLFASGVDKEPFIQIIELEESVTMAIAREKLFGAIYRDYSRAIYESFAYEEVVNKNKVPLQTVRSYYDTLQRRRDVIQIERMDAPEREENKLTYLTAPIRGILSLMVVLCALAATMYFLKEQAVGKFAWLSPRKRVIPAMASCFSAASLSGIAVLGAIQFSGISMGFLQELISMILLIISATGFCILLSVLLRSPGKLGAMMPGLIIIMLVLSPIFFNLKVLRPIRLMLPTYYYLQSVYNYKYYFYTILYCIAIYLVSFIINYIFAEYKYRQSII